MARRDDIKKLIHNHNRRLQILKEQKALEGRSVDPRVLLEIEDIEREMGDLTTELAIIESRINTASDSSEAMTSHNDNGFEHQERKKAYLLVVDDEPDFLKNLCLALEMAGYETIAAKDGNEALTMLRLHSIDLIVSDISMPGMSGYQLYHRVCENRRWIRIPFIFLSARGVDSDIYYGKELGADDYLTKPIKVENLLSVVRGKLHRWRATDKLNSAHLPIEDPVF